MNAVILSCVRAFYLDKVEKAKSRLPNRVVAVESGHAMVSDFRLCSSLYTGSRSVIQGWKDLPIRPGCIFFSTLIGWILGKVWVHFGVNQSTSRSDKIICGWVFCVFWAGHFPALVIDAMIRSLRPKPQRKWAQFRFDYFFGHI